MAASSRAQSETNGASRVGTSPAIASQRSIERASVAWGAFIPSRNGPKNATSEGSTASSAARGRSANAWHWVWYCSYGMPSPVWRKRNRVWTRGIGAIAAQLDEVSALKWS